MEAPKYALFEHERRFLVRPVDAPDLSGAPARLIEDRYLDGRLRLRAVTDLATGARTFKLCKKYPSDDAVSGPITNLYLAPEEHAALMALPGAAIRKRRYSLSHAGRRWGLDVFEGEITGLMLAEIEAESRAAVLTAPIPPWAAREVTGEPFFTGGVLCRASAQALTERLAV